MWYGSFIDNQTLWKGESRPIDVERLRYGLYRQGQDGIRPRFPLPLFLYVRDLIHPFLVTSFFARKWNSEGKEWFWPALKEIVNKYIPQFVTSPVQVKASAHTADWLNAHHVDKEEQEKELQIWKDRFGEKLVLEQFNKLLDLAALVNRTHGTLVVVDMPIPEWHRIHSALFKDYQRKKNPFIKELIAQPNVTYIDFQNVSDNEDFFDSTHPKPKTAIKWTKKLAEVLMNRIHP
ncbi:MAG: hypothetical protein LHV69_11055 [Elusimicrobia bacterium]|nr:hypothetical protein [Candidatus Obscuribacterium magneticum]